jgi:hypothetical protein
VAHEVLALEILTLLLENPTDDSAEVAITFLKEVSEYISCLIVWRGAPIHDWSISWLASHWWLESAEIAIEVSEYISCLIFWRESSVLLHMIGRFLGLPLIGGSESSEIAITFLKEVRKKISG